MQKFFKLWAPMLLGLVLGLLGALLVLDSYAVGYGSALLLASIVGQFGWWYRLGVYDPLPPMVGSGFVSVFVGTAAAVLLAANPKAPAILVVAVLFAVAAIAFAVLVWLTNTAAEAQASVDAQAKA